MRRLPIFLHVTYLLLAGMIACTSPIDETENAGGVIALTNGILIDGTGSAPVPEAVIVIEDQFITKVGSGSGVEVPAGSEVIDLRGSYVIPGMMNTHVHGGYDESNLTEWARNGVTTVRDLGSTSYSPTAAFSLRNQRNSDPRNARLVAAGPLLTTIGGYGSYPVSSPADAEMKTNQLIDLGADLIKIAIEDNLQGREWPLLPMAEIEMIVNTAHGRGKPVSAHISRSEHLEMAVKAGVDDVAHMVIDNLPDSLIQKMIKDDIYWIPTLELWQGVSQLHSLNWDTIAENNLRRFVQAGGKVAIGTDYDGYVTAFQPGMPMAEMELMQEAGMTPIQIIVAGTKHAAHVCALDQELGTIEAGKIADLVVVQNNPLEDLQALLNVQLVIHNGVVIRDSREDS
ncbi:MAG: amidohydrolase family protein [Fidelibacterota bacterium]|nr:MAG: amidohydrolase family protein [Candidatus Neomarinimicrobiota bacterium]